MSDEDSPPPAPLSAFPYQLSKDSLSASGPDIGVDLVSSPFHSCPRSSSPSTGFANECELLPEDFLTSLSGSRASKSIRL